MLKLVGFELHNMGMWAFRGASLPSRKLRSSLGTSFACGRTSSEISVTLESLQSVPSKRLYSTKQMVAYSSQASAKSSGEEDGFTFKAIPSQVREFRDDEEEMKRFRGDMELSENKNDTNVEGLPRDSALFKAILDFPGSSVDKAMDKWVEDGNHLSRQEISLAMLTLRRCRMYWRALQLSEWLDEHKQIEFTEQDYASHIDLVAKVRGLYQAEKEVEMIPHYLRGEIVYRTLVANCVAAKNLTKAEEILNKMKDLEIPITSSTCNLLLILYQKFDKKKITDVLLFMSKENVEPTAFTYRLLLDIKGRNNDINGMEQVYETMKAEGFEPDIVIKAVVAKHYASAGLKEKADELLKEMDVHDLKDKRWACRALLSLYAALGRADQVSRVWKVCESRLKGSECLAAIEAWGNVNKIEEAEAVFEKMVKSRDKLTSRDYAVLLNVYAKHKMLEKGKALVQRMAFNNCKTGPIFWDALVKLHVQCGEIEKADSILQNAIEKNQKKPAFSSFIVLMDQYSKRGDIRNTEKMFYRTRQAGYKAQLPLFQSLVQAYINAKSPLYGIWERMKADNFFPNYALRGKLRKVDPFNNKTAGV